MQNTQLQTRPSYSINSVDNALLLLQMLRDGGELRLKEAAADLGVAQSTAHRLLAMLVYRGFAVQDERRVYRPGPGLGDGRAGPPWARRLRDVALPQELSRVRQVGYALNVESTETGVARSGWRSGRSRRSGPSRPSRSPRRRSGSGCSSRDAVWTSCRRPAATSSTT